MKRKFLTVLLVISMLLSTFLTACDNGASDDDLFGTSEPTKKQQTTSTTAPDTQTEVPKNLTAEILYENGAIGHLINGVTVPIDDKTSITLNYQGWPTICKGEGDTIYAASSLRIGHVDPFGAICFYKSEDGGNTWTDPRIIIDTPLDDRDAGIVYLGNNKLLVSWFTHDTPGYFENDDPTWTKWLDKVTEEQRVALTKKWNALPATEKIGRSYVAISNDGGQTWEEPTAIPVTAPHGPSLMNDGRTLMCIGPAKGAQHCGFSDFKSNNLYIIKSTDYGKTWRHEATLPKPENGSFTFGEAYLIQLQDGSYIAAARGQRTTDNDAMRVWTAFSSNGRTWTDFEEIEGLVGAPPHFLQTESGVLIMAYSYRVQPVGSRARLSYDGGKTWSDEIILCIADNDANGDLGYPSTVELSDGTLVTAYYQRVGNDLYGSFLYTKWKLVEK